MNSYMAKPDTVERKWYVVDAAGKPLGRVASQVASILRGKNKPTFTPHVDTGDYVIVINAAQAILTGRKLDQKKYFHYSGYPGGMKVISYRHLMQNRPEFAMKEAIKGMLPKNALGRGMISKAKIYAGSEHPHAAQQPEKWEI